MPSLFATGHEDLAAACGHHLLDNRVADIRRRVQADAHGGKLVFTLLHDPRLMPRWVYRRCLDAVAVRIPAQELSAEACRVIEEVSMGMSLRRLGDAV